MKERRNPLIPRLILLVLGLTTGCSATHERLETRGAIPAENPAAGHPTLSATDIDGHALPLESSLRSGKPVVFVFWATWCTSCDREASVIVDAYSRFGDRMTFVGVVPGPDSYVDLDKVRAFVARHEISYPQVRDRDLTLTRAFNVKGTPTIVIVDANHRVIYNEHHAPKDWSEFLAATSSATCPGGVCALPAFGG